MKEFFSKFKFNTSLIGIILLLIVTAVNFYFIWYYPTANEIEQTGLEQRLSMYGYNTDLAEDLVEGRKSGYWHMDITMLKHNPDSLPFVYFTSDSVKVTYTVGFWSTPEFFKYNINTQMNILTNIYNTCKYHFQNECRLDSIYYETHIDEFKAYCISQIRFETELIRCIKRHINDKNNIKNVQEVDPKILINKDPEDHFNFEKIGQLGHLSLPSNNFKCTQLSPGVVDNDMLLLIMKQQHIIPDSMKVKLPPMDFNCRQLFFTPLTAPNFSISQQYKGYCHKDNLDNSDCPYGFIETP